MKIITIENLGFDLCDDPVRTEELISNSLLDYAKDNQEDSEYIYVSIPLAWSINTYGLPMIQKFVHDLSSMRDDYKKENMKLAFVCQHIQVKNIDFGDNKVFTPHATIYDKFTPLPHHAPNITNNIREFAGREILISFAGSYSTHRTRLESTEILKNRDDCIMVDTGDWHFYKRDEDLKKSSEFYIKTMNNSKISLCPRGTGPSTIRLWEAMAVGSVPMMISDSLELPLGKEIDWEKHIIRVPERDIKNIEDYILPEDRLQKMSKNCIETYNKYFSESEMHNIILRGINDQI